MAVVQTESNNKLNSGNSVSFSCVTIALFLISHTLEDSISFTIAFAVAPANLAVEVTLVRPKLLCKESV